MVCNHLLSEDIQVEASVSFLGHAKASVPALEAVSQILLGVEVPILQAASKW